MSKGSLDGPRIDLVEKLPATFIPSSPVVLVANTVHEPWNGLLTLAEFHLRGQKFLRSTGLKFCSLIVACQPLSQTN